MTDRAVTLLDIRTDDLVNATLRMEMRQNEFRRITQDWDRMKMKYREILRENGKTLPPNDTWNWEDKASSTTPDLHRFVGVATADGMQGMMMVAKTPEFSRKPYQQQTPVLYIEYIESAPWNLPEYAGVEARYRGVGSSLLAAAVDISIELGFRGRLALHSLGAARGFYVKSGFENLGLDESENLEWFELSGVTIE
jgi:GNAT superfamily N-acetyltransferase